MYPARLFWVTVLGWLVLTGCWGPQAAAAPSTRVVVVLLPGLRVADLTRPELPALRRALQEGAGGWIICREARDSSQPTEAQSATAAVLTLGAGARARAFSPPPANDASLPAALRRWQRENRTLDHPVRLGALGDLIHALSRQTAALGNADASSPQPDAYLFAASSAGAVDFTASASLSDPSAPYGLVTDNAALIAAYERLPDAVALAVIEQGDLARAESYAPLCLPVMAAQHRAEALTRLNALLQTLLPRLRDETVLLLSPAPTPSQSRLAFLGLWGRGVAPGRLLSPSTRWPGLAVNTDILPTIAAALHMPSPRGTAGRPVIAAPGPPATPEMLRAGYGRLVATARLQNLFGGLPTVQMLLTLAGVFLWWRKQKARWIVAVACAIVSLPLALLLLPSVAPSDPVTAGAILAATVALTALLATRLPRQQPFLYALFALLTLTIALDLLTGSHLLRVAWMSYSVLEGARFYGIGNEYMGAVIGAACLLTAGCPHLSAFSLENRRGGVWLPEALLALALGMLTLILGLPGAKVGAIPSAGCAFGALLLVRWRGKLRTRDLLAVGFVSLLLLLVLAAFDLRHGANAQSHLARAFAGEGGDTLFGIARRKLLLEGYLLLHSVWSLTMWVSALIAYGLLRRLPPAVLTGERRAAFVGVAVGVIASLLCNDSGVTAAALCQLFVTAQLLLCSTEASGEKAAASSMQP